MINLFGFCLNAVAAALNVAAGNYGWATLSLCCVLLMAVIMLRGGFDRVITKHGAGQ